MRPADGTTWPRGRGRARAQADLTCSSVGAVSGNGANWLPGWVVTYDAINVETPVTGLPDHGAPLVIHRDERDRSACLRFRRRRQGGAGHSDLAGSAGNRVGVSSPADDPPVFPEAHDRGCGQALRGGDGDDPPVVQPGSDAGSAGPIGEGKARDVAVG